MKMMRMRYVLSVVPLLLLMWNKGGFVMANDSNNYIQRPGAFFLSWSGGLEYGSREMSFDGNGKFYFAKGDTINDDPQTGIGVFMLALQNRDLDQLKEAARLLCDNDIQTGGPETHDPVATFSVVCLDDGTAVGRSGSLRLIPEQFRRKVFDAPFRLSEQAQTEGQKLIKLDFTTLNIDHGDDHYIVSVKFINSGNRWIKFKTPDQWPGTTAEGDLGVAPCSEIGKINPRDDWGFALAGKKLINQDDFPDGVVSLGPGERKILKFNAIPDNRIAKGEYDISGAAFMRIEYEGYGWGLSTHVDFRPIRSRTTFDRDYLSTPQEREQWEATHRADMSFRPVKPGEAFAEDGLYRAERLISGGTYRSLQVMPFKAGDIAATDAVKMPMESGDDVHINGPVQWLWEGSAPQPVKPFATEYVEGTQHHCALGTSCPHSGRWVARTLSGRNALYPDYRYDLSYTITLQRGQTMPSVQNKGDKTEWKWMGGLT